MDFIIIANAWKDGRDNPTSKHRIAIELVRRGHRVFWIDGSGMRTPSIGSSSDRLRMVRKVGAALRGVRREEQLLSCQVDKLLGGNPKVSQFSALNNQQPNNPTTGLWVLSPLFIPLPKYEMIRRLNGLICRLCMRFWSWRLGFHDPVLINYIPVLAEAMRGARRASPQLSSCQVAELPPAEKVVDCQVAELLSQSPSGHPLTTEQHNNPTTSRDSATTKQPNNPTTLSSHPLTTQQPNNPTTTPRAPRVVYHCVDRWDAFSNYDSDMMTEMDKRCCQYADLVIASSQDLVERCRRYNSNVHLVSHGVDHDHFSKALQVTQRPTDLPAGRIAGFFGLLSEWLDQDLIIEVASRVPECEIVLIGKSDVAIEKLKGIRNIHLLGPRPFSQLPAYIAHFDVGLIPFVINELTLAVNPIKLREMLSAGCPVVSTDMPEVYAYSGRGVVVASTVEVFSEAVAKRIRNPVTSAERAAISDSVVSETWSVKVDQILGYVSASI